jgi:hypothetical protein
VATTFSPILTVRRAMSDIRSFTAGVSSTGRAYRRRCDRSKASPHPKRSGHTGNDTGPDVTELQIRLLCCVAAACIQHGSVRPSSAQGDSARSMSSQPMPFPQTSG